MSIRKEKLDVSIEALLRAWKAFRRGKQWSTEMVRFWYSLESGLLSLSRDLTSNNYQHGGYHTFTVTDNKRREINVATVRDRVVHRLLYDYLVERFDLTFIYDVWSCRKYKGLLGAIDRVQSLFKQHRHCYLWRADIKKFFDHIDHTILKRTIARKVDDKRSLKILDTIIDSYRIPLGGGQ